MLYDLHCHSTASDGQLSPEELIQLATRQNINALAITDHDTLGAYDVLAGIRSPVRLITGIEFSSQWRGMNIHVVGLNFDHQSDTITQAVAQQQQARQVRAERIAERLAKAGIEQTLDAATAIAGNDNVGRPHFARHLVERGVVKNTRQAFKQYLGAGKAGDVKQVWASLAQAVEWIIAAGGLAVLAHPAKYKMTYTKLGLLCDDFIAAGGRGIEVSSGLQTATTTRDMAQLCRSKKMLASCGSDFHQPGQPWAELGRYSALPADLTPIWDWF